MSEGGHVNPEFDGVGKRGITRSYLKHSTTKKNIYKKNRLSSIKFQENFILYSAHFVPKNEHFYRA